MPSASLRTHFTPPGECGHSILHTANSYAVTGLEMEQVQEGQGKQTRFDLTQKPLLLSFSGNASHALLLPQARQVWATALYPGVEGSNLPASVKARMGAVEAALTMQPALAHLHMPHSAALTAMYVGLGAVRAGLCNLRIRASPLPSIGSKRSQINDDLTAFSTYGVSKVRQSFWSIRCICSLLGWAGTALRNRGSARKSALQSSSSLVLQAVEKHAHALSCESDHSEGESQIGTSLELSWANRHSTYLRAPNLCQGTHWIRLSICQDLRSSLPEEELGEAHMSRASWHARLPRSWAFSNMGHGCFQKLPCCQLWGAEKILLCHDHSVLDGAHLWRLWFCHE